MYLSIVSLCETVQNWQQGEKVISRFTVSSAVIVGQFDVPDVHRTACTVMLILSSATITRQVFMKEYPVTGVFYLYIFVYIQVLQVT